MKTYDLMLIHSSVSIIFSTEIMPNGYMTPVLRIMHVMHWRFGWVGCVDNSSLL